LSDFFGEEEDRLQNFYSSHRLSFIVNPKIAALDRDKMAIISLLRAAGIPSTKPVKKDLSSILSAVEPGKGVFIKCRYGAEGKGITYLGFDRWCTNYRINGGLENYGVHDPWPFTDITGKEELLGQLLKLEVVVEQEITPPGEEKFDVRLYVVDGKVPHFFERRNSKEKIITNYSQGGRIKHYPNTAIPLSSIEQIKELAIQTADALGFRFLGVDCMFDESFSNPRVVEVQTFTDFPDVRKFNLAEYLAQHLFR
jgi:glutathione synthase/RimK-type ligase-like ATP-grasp enzyme